MKTIIARGDTLDILTFLAAVNRIADLLGVDGDTDPIQVRRSKAVGILGQPDRALALLTAHHHDPDQPVEPRKPRQHNRPWRKHQPDEPEPDAPEPHPGEPDGPNNDGPQGGEPWRMPSDEDEPDDEPADGPEPVFDEPGRRSLNLTPAAASPGAASAGATSAGATSAGNGRGGCGVRVQLYVHLTDAALTGTDLAAICRVEGVGPVTAHTVRRWLGRPDVAVTVRPVTIPGHAIPVDSYEIPANIRDAVRLHQPASAFPWSWCTDRQSLQLDHIRPYLHPDRGGPPGQTAPDNLAPLLGSEHQRKTSRRWHERSPAPGVYLWRSPHGWIHLVTNQGTYPLGNTPTAHAIWHAALPTDDQRPHNQRSQDQRHVA